jgi:metal-dependent amidase/aminoacylase/carboxypeptidase family protein
VNSGEDLYAEAERAVDDRADALWEVALRLHRFPETAYQEHAATRVLGDELRAEGFEVTAGVAGMPTAFVARGGTVSRSAVALLMEYDALPGLRPRMRSQSDRSRRSGRRAGGAGGGGRGRNGAGGRLAG